MERTSRNRSENKLSKNELVKSTLASYLKRRRYTDCDLFLKSDLHLTQTCQEKALFEAVSKEVTRNNTVIFSCATIDTTQIDQQFTRLKAWIADLKTEICQRELAGLLCPLFCHLYLEMLRDNCHLESAINFFTRHQGPFFKQEHNRSLIADLKNIFSNHDIENSKTVRMFRSCKYKLYVSEEAINRLQKFLSKNGHVIIIQILHTWFDFEIGHSVQLPEEAEIKYYKDVSVPDDVVETESCDNSPEPANITMEDDIETMLNNSNLGGSKCPNNRDPLLYYSIKCEDINIPCAAVSSSIKYLAAGMDSAIGLWSLTQEPLHFDKQDKNVSRIHLACDHAINNQKDGKTNSHVSLRGHFNSVQDISFYTKELEPEIIFSVSKDCTMRAWKMADYSCVAVYRGHNYPIWSVDVSALGLYIATGSHDRTACLWTIDRIYPLRIFSGHTLDVECVKFHPNGLYLATGSTDKTVRLWSIGDAKLVRVFPGHKGAVQTIDFSPDGKYLASAGEDKKIRIWDIASGTMVSELRGHSQYVWSVAWSNNSSQVASCSLDHTVRLWNYLPTRECSTQKLCTYTLPSSLLKVSYSIRNALVCVSVDKSSEFTITEKLRDAQVL